jgi:hypothetical protein
MAKTVTFDITKPEASFSSVKDALFFVVKDNLNVVPTWVQIYEWENGSVETPEEFYENFLDEGKAVLLEYSHWIKPLAQTTQLEQTITLISPDTLRVHRVWETDELYRECFTRETFSNPDTGYWSCPCVEYWKLTTYKVDSVNFDEDDVLENHVFA